MQDLIYRHVLQLFKPRLWQTPPEFPTRTELRYFDECFGFSQAEAALESLKPHLSKLRHLPERFFTNDYIGPADVAFYCQAIWDSRPKVILEIGSGHSTEVAAMALRQLGHGRMVCIDPEPRVSIRDLPVTWIARKIQDIDEAVFREVSPGDIVFIDSSHTLEEALVHHRFLNELPPGVNVHFHDIDYPWERPNPVWREDLAVHDFLRARSWKVRVYGSFLTLRYLSELRRMLPYYNKTPYRKYNALWAISAPA